MESEVNSLYKRIKAPKFSVPFCIAKLYILYTILLNLWKYIDFYYKKCYNSIIQYFDGRCSYDI